MQLRLNDWTSVKRNNSTSPVLFFLSIFRSSVKFCPHGRRVGEERLAQSSLAMLCITRMQMSYETIHLLEMPP